MVLHSIVAAKKTQKKGDLLTRKGSKCKKTQNIAKVNWRFVLCVNSHSRALNDWVNYADRMNNSNKKRSKNQWILLLNLHRVDNWVQGKKTKNKKLIEIKHGSHDQRVTSRQMIWKMQAQSASIHPGHVSRRIPCDLYLIFVQNTRKSLNEWK